MSEIHQDSFILPKWKRHSSSSVPQKEERGMFQTTLYMNSGLETTLQWTTSACLYHCAQLNGSRPVHFSIIIDPLMLIAEVVVSVSKDKFLQFQRKTFYPGIEKFKTLVFSLSIFLVWSSFDQWKTYKILVYFLFFTGLLFFCCPGASNETASVNLVWKETPRAYTFRESKLFLKLCLRFFIKTSWRD